MAVESSRHCVCSVACFPLLSDRLQRLTGLSESSSASAQAAQAGSQTKGVVSLAHSLLFGCLWQQDPNNLDMWLCLKKKKKNWEWNPKQEFGPFSWWKSCGE